MQSFLLTITVVLLGLAACEAAAINSDVEDNVNRAAAGVRWGLGDGA